MHKLVTHPSNIPDCDSLKSLKNVNAVCTPYSKSTQRDHHMQVSTDGFVVLLKF